MSSTKISSGMPFFDITLSLVGAFADIMHKVEAMGVRFTPVVTRDYRLVHDGRGSIDACVVSPRLKNVCRAFSSVITERETASRALVKRNIENLQRERRFDAYMSDIDAPVDYDTSEFLARHPSSEG